MGFSRKVLRDVMVRLNEVGVEGVIIGSTVLMLYLGLNEFEDDIDIFATNFSPCTDEDLVRSAAAKLGCELSQSTWGTPALYCIFNSDEVVIELHENILDFYIPNEILRTAKESKVIDIKVKHITIEDYIVLKARAGRNQDLEDLNILSDLVKRGDLRVNLNLIKDRIREVFPEEEKLILSRLKLTGFKV